MQTTCTPGCVDSLEVFAGSPANSSEQPADADRHRARRTGDTMTEALTPAAATPVTYEYASIRAERDLEPLYRDTYAGFGWSIEGYGPALPSTAFVTLKLKRPRHLRNRPQVVELQRKAEHALAEIARLEKTKTTSAFATSMAVGIVGCAFLAGSVFAISGGHDDWGLSIPLGAIGLLAWLAGYLTFGRVRARRTAAATPLIDHQYDVVYEACEQAAHLLG